MHPTMRTCKLNGETSSTLTYHFKDHFKHQGHASRATHIFGRQLVARAIQPAFQKRHQQNQLSLHVGMEKNLERQARPLALKNVEHHGLCASRKEKKTSGPAHRFAKLEGRTSRNPTHPLFDKDSNTTNDTRNTGK